MKKLFFLVFAFVALMIQQTQAFDFREAALEKPDLSSTISESRPFASGLLGSDGVTVDTKSTSKAVLYSLLLPGLGQWYLGEKGQAKIFFALDAVILTSFIVFTAQTNLREEEYQEYARAFAGITASHSDDYYGILTEHDSFQEYRDEIKGEGRLNLYPDVDTATLEQYFVDNRISDYEAWVWQSADHRRAYQDRRASSKTAERRALYSVAAALANRVASGFFAYRSGRRAKQEGSGQQTGLLIEFGAHNSRVSEGFQTGISVVQNF